MPPSTATAIASPNIALIKYWGNRDDALRLPANGSISLTLGGLETQTTVTFDPRLGSDCLEIDGLAITGAPLARVQAHLDRIRAQADVRSSASVISRANFPSGAGIAASAAAFASLTLAATAAAGLQLSPSEASRLARRGSGSACRSMLGGYVEWHAGTDDQTSVASQIAPPEHWALTDLIALVSRQAKPVGSTQGHALAPTSPIQRARVADCPRRLVACRAAIRDRDFDHLAATVEQDSNLMHAVMLTSSPPLIYWEPSTLTILRAVSTWRSEGLPVCTTIDAGPNVHVLCPAEFEADLRARLDALPEVIEILRGTPGPGARLA
jgi:diphosphomevalonate decarboxylase